MGAAFVVLAIGLPLIVDEALRSDPLVVLFGLGMPGVPFFVYYRFMRTRIASLVTGPVMVCALVGYYAWAQANFEDGVEFLGVFISPWAALVFGGLLDELSRLLAWWRQRRYASSPHGNTRALD